MAGAVTVVEVIGTGTKFIAFLNSAGQARGVEIEVAQVVTGNRRHVMDTVHISWSFASMR
jgi:hypothetical protein